MNASIIVSGIVIIAISVVNGFAFHLLKEFPRIIIALAIFVCAVALQAIIIYTMQNAISIHDIVLAAFVNICVAAIVDTRTGS